MQIRELSPSELHEGFPLLKTLRLDLTATQFERFIASQFPRDYRPIGAYERGVLHIYAGVTLRENLELGRYLIVEDFAVREHHEHLSKEMIDFLGDYARMHTCSAVIVWGRQKGLSLKDLEGYRPKRDGWIKQF
ncbi:MAG: hypothetical protein M0P91_11915 [Sulfuricurvum sp.]|jgi:hypothetical protein|uniref:hypothetical protein n=1 Tax=Sulfuricurvum sp. TaxID=2025608 RepID=UPI0025D2FF4A|nr:hypothetical protein [Sulfuricurvum sp.]MCK9373894.1 hypothetical protein [Sulfuricurvum sp.]